MPWCPICAYEYDEGVTLCPDCEVELQEEKPKSPKIKWGRAEEKKLQWPTGEGGEPETPAFLMNASGIGGDDEMTIGMLRAYGIPVIRDYPQAGQISKIMFGFAGTGTDLFVPQSMLEDAKTLLKDEEE